MAGLGTIAKPGACRVVPWCVKRVQCVLKGEVCESGVSPVICSEMFARGAWSLGVRERFRSWQKKSRQWKCDVEPGMWMCDAESGLHVCCMESGMGICDALCGDTRRQEGDSELVSAVRRGRAGGQKAAGGKGLVRAHRAVRLREHRTAPHNLRRP
eukprot:740536-Rhodomonas_salina.3